MKDLVTKNILLARNKKFIGKVYRMEKIEYQAFTNQNNNISRINGLLERIGTNSKPFFNKITFKKSKSVEFLELIDINLDNILKNINLDNITRQLNKSKKLFEKLLVEFTEKIKNKRPNNKERLQTQIDVIYNKYHTFFLNFSKEIFKIIQKNTLSIEQLKILLSIQDELITLFNSCYEKYNKKNWVRYTGGPFYFHNIYLKEMKGIKKFISNKIFLMTPNVKSRNINALFSESDSLYKQLTEMSESEIIKLSKEKKQELYAYIIDLVKFIYNKTVFFLQSGKLTQSVLEQSRENLLKLRDLNNLIFKNQYNAMRRSRKYNQFEEWEEWNIIPNKNTYENLKNKNQEIYHFIHKLPRPNSLNNSNNKNLNGNPNFYN